MIRAPILLLILLSQISYAEGCRDTAMTQRAINECAYKKSQSVEVMLTKLETEIASSLEVDAKSKFLKSKEAWRVVVSHDCEIESGFFSGGSIEPTIYASCTEEHIKQRIVKIRYFLCPNWPMTGICPAESQYKVNL